MRGLEAQPDCFRELSRLTWHGVEADSSTYRKSARTALNTGQICCRNFSYKAARYLVRLDIELAKFWPQGRLALFRRIGVISKLGVCVSVGLRKLAGQLERRDR